MHIYLICPYLYSPILRLHWAKAIETCGYDLNARSTPTPLADVLAKVVEEWRRAELQRLLLTRRNGEPVLVVPNPVIDIEQCYEGIEHEVIKYLVKDAERDENGVLLFDEDFLARVYEGTEGFRMLQSSRHFWVPIESNACACAGCGSTKVTRKIEAAQPAEDTAPSWSEMDLPPAHWRRDMKSSNVVEIPVFVDVDDVRASMKCSRTMAYAHMRAALGRAPGERGQIRVPVYVWRRYVLARFDPEARQCPSPLKPRAPKGQPDGPIQITRPRTRPRLPERIS